MEFAVSLFPNAEFYLVHAYNIFFKSFLHEGSTRRDFLNLQNLRFHTMIEEEMGAFFASVKTNVPKFKKILQEGSAPDVIRRQRNLLNSDIIVIGTHGRTGVARAFLGSVAEDLFAVPPCDVLAVKAW